MYICQMSLKQLKNFTSWNKYHLGGVRRYQCDVRYNINNKLQQLNSKTILRLLSVDNSPNQKKQDPIYEEHYGRVRKYSDDKNVKWQFESAGGPSYLVSQLRSVFLPINYPSSVHPCYVKFHAWQALETYVAAVVGVLCSQAMLESLGISKAASTAGAVAIQWVLKDGIAEMGKLLFIKRYARSFDSHPRTWKAIGEVLTTLGSGLQLCTILVPSNYFLLLAASGNILKSVSWAVWGVTHMWFIRNFALSNNVGDLSAKAEAQSALALVSGWMSGVVLLSYSHSPATLFLTYLLLAPVHGLATYKELKNAEIGSMNNAKALVLCRGFVHNNGTDVYQVGDAQIEKWIGILGESLRKKPKRSLDNGKLKQHQYQTDDAFDRLPDVRMGSTIESSFDALQDAKMVADTIRDENYLLGVRTLMRSDGSRQRTIHIVLHKEAEGRDSLKALLNAVKLDQMLDLRTLQKEDELCHNKKMMSIFKDSHQWTLDHFASFIAKLDNHDWQTESVLFSDAGFRAQWKKSPKNDVIDLEIPPQSTSASDPKSQQ